MPKKQKYIAIIPARGGSKELKNKNILEIASVPLIAYSIKAAQISKTISDVYVSTDSAKIAKIAKDYGARVIKRPANLATDSAKQDDVMKHAVTYLEKKLKRKISSIILLQATSPIREKNDIDRAVEKFEKLKVDALFSSVHIDLCVWRKKLKNLLPVNFTVEERGNRQHAETDLVENGSIYITKVKCYFSKKIRFGNKRATHIMKKFSIFEIDNIEEFKLIDMMIESKSKIFKDIVRF